MKKTTITLCMLLLFSLTVPAFAGTNKSLTTTEMMELLDKDMDSAGVKHDPNVMSAAATTTVTIGTNKIFTNANAGNSGGSKDSWLPLASYAGGFGYASSPGWADAGTYVITKGTAGYWAWIGNGIVVSGSGSRSAKITYSGRFKAQLQTSTTTTGSTAEGKVVISVIDLGTGSVVASKGIWSQKVGGMMPPAVEKYFNDYVTCALTAGRSYALRIGVSAASNSAGDIAVAQLCDYPNQWSPQPGGYGSDYSSIAIAWQ